MNGFCNTCRNPCRKSPLWSLGTRAAACFRGSCTPVETPVETIRGHAATVTGRDLEKQGAGLFVGEPVPGDQAGRLQLREAAPDLLHAHSRAGRRPAWHGVEVEQRDQLRPAAAAAAGLEVGQLHQLDEEPAHPAGQLAQLAQLSAEDDCMPGRRGPGMRYGADQAHGSAFPLGLACCRPLGPLGR